MRSDGRARRDRRADRGARAQLADRADGRGRPQPAAARGVRAAPHRHARAGGDQRGGRARARLRRRAFARVRQRRARRGRARRARASGAEAMPQLGLAPGPIERVRADVAVVPLFAGERPLRAAAGRVDWRLCGRLSHLFARGTALRRGRRSGAASRAAAACARRACSAWARASARGSTRRRWASWVADALARRAGSRAQRAVIALPELEVRARRAARACSRRASRGSSCPPRSRSRPSRSTRRARSDWLRGAARRSRPEGLEIRAPERTGRSPGGRAGRREADGQVRNLPADPLASGGIATGRMPRAARVRRERDESRRQPRGPGPRGHSPDRESVAEVRDADAPLGERRRAHRAARRTRPGRGDQGRARGPARPAARRRDASTRRRSTARAASRAASRSRSTRRSSASAACAPERLASLRREHVERSVMRMFGWRSGEFSFEIRDELSADDRELLLPSGLNTQYLAMEATRLGDEISRRAARRARCDATTATSRSRCSAARIRRCRRIDAHARSGRARAQRRAPHGGGGAGRPNPPSPPRRIAPPPSPPRSRSRSLRAGRRRSPSRCYGVTRSLLSFAGDSASALNAAGPSAVTRSPTTSGTKTSLKFLPNRFLYAASNASRSSLPAGTSAKCNRYAVTLTPVAHLCLSLQAYRRAVELTLGSSKNFRLDFLQRCCQRRYSRIA